MSNSNEEVLQTVDAWKQKAVHTVTLPSGAVVQIVVPNLPAIVKSGVLPSELLPLAKAAAFGTSGELSDDMVEKLPELQRELAILTSHSPKLDSTTVDQVPYEDVIMLSEFAIRTRDTDALGEHISGMEKLSDFARFRDLGSGGQDILDFGAVG